MTQPAQNSVRLGEIRLVLPAGYVDRTLYAFRSKDREEELLVEPTTERNLKSPAAVVDDRFGEVKGYFNDDVKVQSNNPRRLGALDIQILTYLLADKGGSATMGISALALGNSRYLEFKYAAKPTVENAAPRWAAITASVAVPQTPAVAAPAVGISRRYLIDATVDVPDTLSCNLPYVLNDSTAKSRLVIAVGRLGKPIPAPTLPRDDDRPEVLPRIADAKKEALTIALTHAEFTSYILHPSPDAPASAVSERVFRIETILDTLLAVRVEFRGPAAASASLEAQARALSASIELVK